MALLQWVRRIIATGSDRSGLSIEITIGMSGAGGRNEAALITMGEVLRDKAVAHLRIRQGLMGLAVTTAKDCNNTGPVRLVPAPP